METTLTKHDRNLAAFIHASTFSKYFVPFGNFIAPLILWTANRKNSVFVDHNGKQALNFQLSMLLYSIAVWALSIPIFVGLLPSLFDGGFWGIGKLSDLNNMDIHISSDDFSLGHWLWPAGISGLAHAGLLVINVVYTILATIRTNEGEYFNYPFTIGFVK